MSTTLIPHQRLLEIDARLEQAAAKPVIVPETIGIDHGKVFVSNTFLTACRSLGVSVQPSRPATPTDKGIVERTFSSIKTLFCQHIPGYTGPNTTRRGAEVEAVWTLAELDDLLQEWIVACWQQRPHEGLRSPFLPGRPMSPNDAYALLVSRTSYLPMPLSGPDYLELLPALWRSVNDYGIRVDHRTYNCPGLNPMRRRSSGVTAKGGFWEVHYDPYDLSQIWVRDARTGEWITVPWTHRHLVSAPFADFTWRRARDLLAMRGQDDTNQAAVAAAVDRLLTRAESGPDRRIAARTRTALEPARSVPALPQAPAPEAATKEAQHMVRSWLLNKKQPHLLSRWNDRLAQLPPKEAAYENIIRRRVDEREYIATYPEFVTMLGMVADPAWRARRAPRRWVNLSQHRRTIDAVYAEAGRRFNVPSLREKRQSHTFSNDALFRWTDSSGRSLMLVMTPEDHNALRDDSQWN